MDGNGNPDRDERVRRSKKAHIKPPLRRIRPTVKPGRDEREVGQFTGEGNPGLEKK
jgi:hypothetical protein